MGQINIPRDEMLELMYGADVVRDRIIEHRRWSVDHELIFRRDGRLWRAWYSVGATENQEEGPFDNAPDPVGCVEVVEVPAVDYAVRPEAAEVAAGVEVGDAST
jgi:hypothetical protein